MLLKWIGLVLEIVDLINRNSDLHINFRKRKGISACLLTREVWTEITKHLSIEEVYSFKFLCKRFFKIALFHKKNRYFTVISHKMFDVNGYYNTFCLMIENLLSI